MAKEIKFVPISPKKAESYNILTNIPHPKPISNPFLGRPFTWLAGNVLNASTSWRPKAYAFVEFSKPINNPIPIPNISIPNPTPTSTITLPISTRLLRSNTTKSNTNLIAPTPIPNPVPLLLPSLRKPRQQPGEDPKSGFRCPKCDYRNIKITKINRHLETHLTTKPYECHVCERRFARKEHLQHHVAHKHDKEKIDVKYSKKRKPLGLTTLLLD